MDNLTGRALYVHIEAVAKLHGYRDISDLCRKSGASRGALSDLNNGKTYSS